MRTLSKIAWRSLWRNRRRTIITVSAIAFSLAVAVFFLALADGVYEQMITDAVRMQAGHFTLEHPGYRDAPSVDLAVGDVAALRDRLRGIDEVEQTKAMVVGQGVLKSSTGTVGVALIGIEPGVEREMSPLARRLKRGAYLQDGDTRKVVIGADLADRLNVDVGKKLVVSTNNTQGELVEELLRVKGIFKVGSSEVDGYVAQVPLSFARRLYDLGPDEATQVGVLLKSTDHRDRILSAFASTVADTTVAVHPWEDVMPDLASYVRIDRGSNQVFQAIIIFLSLFTIFNTILMSVLERTREFAVLLALGTPAAFLRRQVLCESVLLGLLGVLVGLGLGGGLGYFLHVHGLDVSAQVGEELSVSGFAMDPKMHARVTMRLLAALGGIVLCATVLVSAYAARRIGRIRVADVLRARG